MKRSGGSDGAGGGNNFFRPDILAVWVIYQVLNYIYRTVIMPMQNTFRLDEIDTYVPFDGRYNGNNEGNIFASEGMGNEVVEYAIVQQAINIDGAALVVGGHVAHNGRDRVLYAGQRGYINNINPENRERGLIILAQLAEYLINQERIIAEQNAARFEILPDDYVDGDNIPGVAMEQVENVDQQIVAVGNAFPILAINYPAIMPMLEEFNRLIDYFNMVNPIVIPGEVQAIIYARMMESMALNAQANANALVIEDTRVEEDDGDTDNHAPVTRCRRNSMVDEDSDKENSDAFRSPFGSSIINQGNLEAILEHGESDADDDHVVVPNAGANNATIAILLADNFAPEPVLLITNGEATFAQAIGFVPMNEANDEDSHAGSVIIGEGSEVVGGTSILEGAEEL